MADDRLSTFAIAGAGTRGEVFAQWIVDHATDARVTAVADPVAHRRQAIADLCDIPEAMQFDSWEQMLSGPRVADAVINATMDRAHAAVCRAAFPKGYHMLLEKPMGITAAECADVDRLARENGCIVSVCHSLRYVPVLCAVKRMLEAGVLGDLSTFDQLSAVGPEHFAHSYVRGNWATESDSSFALLAKSCHDIDQLAWMADRPCRRVSSFGGLTVFRPENAPVGAPDFCVNDCPHEKTCLFSAVRIYGPDPIPHRWEQAKMPADGEKRMDLLATSQYGRCVWRCDNDVADHQVVSFEFDRGLTGTFTASAFGQENRLLRICGTLGALEADLNASRIELTRFGRPGTETIDVPADEGIHGGGDELVIESLVAAMQAGDCATIASGTAETLESHRIVFAAEWARRTGSVVDLDSWDDSAEMPPNPDAR